MRLDLESDEDYNINTNMSTNNVNKKSSYEWNPPFSSLPHPLYYVSYFPTPPSPSSLKIQPPNSSLFSLAHFLPLFLAPQIGLFLLQTDFRNMLGSNSNNSVLPISLGENCFQGEVNALPQLQLFGDVMTQSATDLVGCTGGPINHVRFEQRTTIERPPKRDRGAESFSRQQHHQLSLSDNFHQLEAGQCGTIMKPNPVSIGLKVSSSEEEHNSSVTYACDRKTAVLPILSSLSQSLKVDIDRQQQEFDHHLRLQEDNMIKGTRELGQRHQISLLSAIETGFVRKLHAKELEIEKTNRKNTELVERIKQISKEVQSWQCRAKYNESVVNALKSNLKRVMGQGIVHAKEGCGDSEVDTAASNANLKHKSVIGANSLYLGKQMICRACKTNEASIMLLPCRHLCLCKDCAGFVNACPICQIIRTSGVEVFTS